MSVESSHQPMKHDAHFSSVGSILSNPKSLSNCSLFFVILFHIRYEAVYPC